jgi:uncharacterized protein YkwD
MAKSIFSGLLMLLFLSSFQVASNQHKKEFDAKLSAEELELYELMMAYRKENNLPSIPLSKSLTFVAQTHCNDLTTNTPDVTESCNAHSWSDKGGWTPCCYTSDHAQAACLWDKPRELTNYTGTGFEIAVGSSEPRFSKTTTTAQRALDQWKSSVHHNNVVLNKDIWESRTWNAIGIGMKDNFACVWFGKIEDPEGEPER